MVFQEGKRQGMDFMMMSRFVSVLLLCPGLCFGDSSPLFASDTPLDLVFEFPVSTIVKEAEDRPVVEGKVHYTSENGAPVSVGLTMTTRGKSRLEYCDFPPLLADFKSQEKDGTLFKGQKKLKIVTQCNPGETFERYLMQEYGIYLAFNALTDKSFRVRKINATYRDSTGKKDDLVASAFFLEADNELAERLGMQTHEISMINPTRIDPAHASLGALFQYLIANTDWSTIQGPEGDECCHNGKVIILPGSSQGWLVVPYDFDQAGIINTKYAGPAEELGIRSVRQRVYRGRCINLDQLETTISLFNERRSAIETALLPEAVQGKFRESTIGYIDDFYKIINDPSQRIKRIEKECIGGE
jgi:hypothetical protein